MSSSYVFFSSSRQYRATVSLTNYKIKRDAFGRSLSVWQVVSIRLEGGFRRLGGSFKKVRSEHYSRTEPTNSHRAGRSLISEPQAWFRLCGFLDIRTSSSWCGDRRRSRCPTMLLLAFHSFPKFRHRQLLILINRKPAIRSSTKRSDSKFAIQVFRWQFQKEETTRIDVRSPSWQVNKFIRSVL